ncbi:response regulator [Allocoleopsis sp.]|uniref:response regulator n=1 Tax=Allocoleopsis sp. TaxID=3088169 RepID=UPI0032C218DF
MNVNTKFSLGIGESATPRQPLVLVVDDNEDNLSLLAFLVEQMDCTLLTAPNGQTALDLVANHQPSLVLLDMMLPDLDGLEVLGRIRQNPVTAKIPVIAVTAMARQQDRDRILSAGCNEYVTKPYNVDEIEALMRRYLSQSG